MRVQIADIKVGDRYRQEYTGIDELAASIADKGLMHPLVVDQELNLIAGGRRLRALNQLGWLECDVTVLDVSDELGRRQCELIENIQRENLPWQDEVKLKAEIDRLYKQMHGDKEGKGIKKGWSLTKTAELLGEGHATTSRDINLAEAMEMIPELKTCATKGEAQKKFSQLSEEVIMKELQRRAATSVIKTDEEQVALNADAWYNVGDALEGMDVLLRAADEDKTLHHNFVIAEVDPPYGINLGALRQGNIDESYNEVEAEKYQRFIEITAYYVYNLLNTNAWCIWWFGPTHQQLVKTALEDAGFVVDEIPAIWVKQQGQTNQPDKYFARAWEGFFLCRKGSPVMHKRGRLNVFQYPGVASQLRIHPTERPLELVLDILQTLCPPSSGRVLVPFLGSGNTLRAALFNGMDGVGWDIEGDKTKALFLARILGDFKKLKESLNGAGT